MLTDLLTHWIDVVHWYMGVDTPLTAVTTGRNYRMKTWDWPDAVTATLEYPRDFMVTHTGTYGSSIDDGGLEFRGDRGTLKIDRERLLVYNETAAGLGLAGHTPEPEIHVRSHGRRLREPPAELARLHPQPQGAQRAHARGPPGRAGRPRSPTPPWARRGRVRFNEKTGKVEAV